MLERCDRLPHHRKRRRRRNPTGDIADQLDMKTTSLGPVRAQLMKKGMVYSPAYGEMAFTVPLFDEFIRRVMP